jgi:subtilisin
MSSSILEALEVPLSDLLKRNLAPVDVAILDSGIDATHPMLSGRVVEAFGVTKTDGQDTIVAVAQDTDNDQIGHGTAVGSIIARIAPNARLFDVRVLGADNTCSDEILAAGIRHGTAKGWAVLNLSLAAGYRLRGDLEAVCEAAYYRGQALIAARRNIPVGGDGLPAELPSCIGVDLGSYQAPFEFGFLMGSPIEVIAGGEGIVVAARGGGFKTVTGTSFATPAISGLCALLLDAFPDLQPYELKSILRSRAFIGNQKKT